MQSNAKETTDSIVFANAKGVPATPAGCETFNVSTNWNSWVFNPLSLRCGRWPVFPHAWQRIFQGERRTYESDFPPIECLERLRSVVSRESPDPFEVSAVKAVGIVRKEGFRIVLRGGMAGERGLVPMLYGHFEDRSNVTLIHAFQGVPVLVGFGVCAFVTASVLLSVIGPIPRFIFGKSLTGDFTFDLVILSFTIVSLFIVSGWMWLINHDWGLKRFDFLAEILDARRIDDPTHTK